MLVRLTSRYGDVTPVDPKRLDLRPVVNGRNILLGDGIAVEDAHHFAGVDLGAELLRRFAPIEAMRRDEIGAVEGQGLVVVGEAQNHRRSG